MKKAFWWPKTWLFRWRSRNVVDRAWRLMNMKFAKPHKVWWRGRQDTIILLCVVAWCIFAVILTHLGCDLRGGRY